MDFSQIVTQRRAVKHYDPDHQITDAELRAIFDKVVLAPSSFNLQHWRFVVVRDHQLKAKLREVSYGQEQVQTASAVVVILGKLDAHRDAAEIYADAPAEVKKTLLPMIEQFYANNPALRRDEAIRSAALAAMTLMCAAGEMGYATGPMIGFDPRGVAQLIGADDNHVPLMLVAIGKSAGESRPRPTRLPPDRVVKLENLHRPRPEVGCTLVHLPDAVASAPCGGRRESCVSRTSSAITGGGRYTPG